MLVELPFQIIFPCAMVSQLKPLLLPLLLPLPLPPLLPVLVLMLPVMVVLSRWVSAVPIRSEQR